MDISLLKTATERRAGYRRWNGLRLLHNVGSVAYGSGIFTDGHNKPIPGMHFWWSFHEHRGGIGGLDASMHRDEIRERVRNLLKHQEAMRGLNSDVASQ